MWMAILGLIPGLLGFAEKFQASWFDAKVRITTARIGGDVDAARAMVAASVKESHERNGWLAVMASNRVLMLLLVAFALPLVIYEWQIIVHDIIWCAGKCSTDPIRGQVADWANTIIIAIFGSGSVLGIGKMYFGRSDK